MSDHAWIQRALNVGGLIELPARDIWIDQTLVIHKACVIRGRGRGATTIKWGGDDSGLNMISVDMRSSNQELLLCDFDMHGNKKATNAIAILGDAGDNPRRGAQFDNMGILGCSNAGFYIDEAGQLTGGLLSRIEFNDNSNVVNQLDYCVYKSISSSNSDNTQATRFVDCWFRKAQKHGVYWYNDSPGTCRTARWDRCVFEYNEFSGLHLRNARGSVTQCHFEGNGMDTGTVYPDIWMGGDASPANYIMLRDCNFSSSRGDGQEYDAVNGYFERMRVEQAGADRHYVSDCYPPASDDHIRLATSCSVTQVGKSWTTAAFP